ncbi:hypothetical protein ACE1SV_74510 [Streptomyces sp. E-15]
MTNLTHPQTPEHSRFPGWTDWQLAREYLTRARYTDSEGMRELFTENEIRRATAYLAVGRLDTDRLTAIEDRVKAVPAGWRQRDIEWLIQQLRQAWAWLDELRDRIDDAGSLMHTSYVGAAIGYVPSSREGES